MPLRSVSGCERPEVTLGLTDHAKRVEQKELRLETRLLVARPYDVLGFISAEMPLPKTMMRAYRFLDQEQVDELLELVPLRLDMNSNRIHTIYAVQLVTCL